MSTQPLEKAVDITKGVLASLSDDQLAAPTPCDSWNVAEVVNHLINGQHFFTAAVTGNPPFTPDAGRTADELRTNFEASSAALVAAFSADGALAKTVTLPFGELPGAAVMGIAMRDAFVHGWDVARATGQSSDLAPELATAILANSRQTVPDSMRGADTEALWGAEVVAPDGASPADQLAAFLGRDPSV